MKNAPTIFIANDNTVFNNEFDCRLHDGIATMTADGAPFQIYNYARRLCFQEELDMAQLIYVSDEATDDDKKNLIAILMNNYNTNIIDNDGEPIALGDLALFDSIRTGWYYVYSSEIVTRQWHFIDFLTIVALRNHTAK